MIARSARPSTTQEPCQRRIEFQAAMSIRRGALSNASAGMRFAFKRPGCSSPVGPSRGDKHDSSARDLVDLCGNDLVRLRPGASYPAGGTASAAARHSDSSIQLAPTIPADAVAGSTPAAASRCSGRDGSWPSRSWPKCCGSARSDPRRSWPSPTDAQRFRHSAGTL
jgi:hypothetical protein